MTRPAVSVVMPFAGDSGALNEALAALGALRVEAEDELILAENSGLAPGGLAVPDGVVVVRASDEQSPAHARNVGAAHAHNEWILFLDADCRPPAELLDAYFEPSPGPEVGALAGEVRPGPDDSSLAARYGSARSFLSQASHLAHPYLPRAVAANLLVRRAAFEQIGGFYEGLRAAEDTDFSWRLQRAGWRLELRADAAVVHRYRASVAELRAQWRGYAAGRAWLRRRYADFTPQPAVKRALGRLASPRRPGAPSSAPRRAGGIPTGQRAQHLALDAMLGVEELAGFLLSNRPASQPRETPQVVLVADRFPSRGDPLVDFAQTVEGARIEASARPDSPWLEVGRRLDIAYREDDGTAARVLASLWLLGRHPWRSLIDLRTRRAGAPGLGALAPAALRLARSPAARVHGLGGAEARTTARRLAALTGRELEEA